MPFEPNDKAVLITGCSTGIGYCAAHGLRQHGYRVIASARKADDVRRLQSEGLTVVQLDLADSDSIARAVEQTLELTQGRLYALFNNGAYGQPGAVEDLSRDALREQFETNLFGTVDLTNRIIPVMRRQGFGRIIQNSSLLGLVALRYRGAYTASKFALEGITDTLRMELRDSGIKVSLIEPGPITSRFRANALAAFRKHIDQDQSVHREIYQKLLKRLAASHAVAPFTLQPEAVLVKLLHALEASNPKPRYHVTTPTRIFAVARRLLPTTLLDRLMLRISRDENR